MPFSWTEFLHGSPKLACAPTHASVILVDGSSSSIHLACTSGGFIANLIPKMNLFSSFVSTFVFESSGVYIFIQLLTDDPSFIYRLPFPQQSCASFSPSSKSDTSVNRTIIGTTFDTMSTQYCASSRVSCLCPSVE